RRPLPEAAARGFATLVGRRAAREPLHYIVGEREFWSLPLAVDRRVLVPRPETELVVETALGLAPGARRILDVGTGSGAIAAALARELAAVRRLAEASGRYVRIEVVRDHAGIERVLALRLGGGGWTRS